MTTSAPRHVAATITDNGVSFFLDGKSYVVNREHPGYDKIVAALRFKSYDEIPALMDVSVAMEHFFETSDPNFEVKSGIVYYKDKPFTDEVSEKVLSMTGAGMPSEPLVNFLKKLRKNPSAIAQRETLLFAVANGFLIHEDGDIIAYKAVREDYFDVHSGTVTNKPAHLMGEEELAALPSTTGLGVTVEVENGITVVSMERGEVDDNREVTCSVGLHFAAHSYARSFTGGPRMLVLKISPADVVSIPSDYANAKGRCARYEVIAEIEDEHIKANGMEHREVFRDSDFGDGFNFGGCGDHEDYEDSGEDDLEDEEEDAPTREETIRTVCELIADFSGTYFKDFVEDNRNLTLSRLDVSNLHTLDDRLSDDFDNYSSGELDSHTTVNDIVANVLNEENYSELITTLKEKIVTREIFDGVTFRNVVQIEGYDPDEPRVSEAIKAGGLGRWA
jgi:hypothetical protein